ncbi:uncharacterized protein LOC5505103 [Nematostella vectensis]|uniref:uncharacterized protein LOC5505103 n=1 Tax=Nematostella vectensis TaxID=45351 RepID=UPI0020770716|nr:uncharacterized protein LOC5505103 [Nematostella vectensis]XP_048578086.1 uncharacterized protein LOC5505103 [Nematostella vectensis]
MLIRILLAFAFLGSFAVLGHGRQCPVSFDKVGCYDDSRTRPLPAELVNDRDPNSTVWSGQWFDWHDFQGSVESLLCRCSEKARQGGHKYVGIQFFAECWSGANKDASLLGAPSHQCSQGNSDNSEIGVPCQDSSSLLCAGAADTNYVYRVRYCQEQLDIAILLDVSMSMEWGLSQAQNFTSLVIGSLKDIISEGGTHVGLITFANEAEIVIGLDDIRSRDWTAVIHKVMNSTQLSGNTYANKALKLAETTFFTEAKGMRPGSAKVVITLSDGRVRQDAEPYYLFMDPLQNEHGVAFMGVAVGDFVSKEVDAFSRYVPRFDAKVPNMDKYLVMALEKFANEHCTK